MQLPDSENYFVLPWLNQHINVGEKYNCKKNS